MDQKINDLRLFFENLGRGYEKAENVSVTKDVIEHIDCYWFKAEEELNTNKIVVYLHGGGFVLGSIKSHQALVSHLANHLSLPILFIEYSLAPEKPYPHAVNDVLSIYDYLLREYSDTEIVFMGDSAGGGLAVSAISEINKRGLRRPNAAVLISPHVDLSCTNDSLETNAQSDPVLTKQFVQDMSSLYMNGSDLAKASPAETLFGEFPPTLILAGSGEILLDDSKSIYNYIVGQNVEAKLSIYENQHHVWMLKDIHTEESQKAVNEIRDFVILN
jgi:epsilon-lactone hydrolase